MSPNPPARRISYVIPPPAQNVPRLILPRLGADRHGSTTPLLISASPENDSEVPVSTPNQQYSHPKHRLGISSFALDTSTRLTGKTSPEGILYSGGRDGQVIAHELGVALKHRTKPYGINPDRKATGKSWEAITGWREIEGNEEEEQDSSDAPEIPYENTWEVNSSVGEPSIKSSFRQSVQTHSDWINDILLCNFNRTLVSCSSDGTVKAWSPHDPEGAMDPLIVGRHSDYVRCLTRPRHQKWIASGAFDRTIKLWDLSNKKQEPTLTLSPPEATNAKASIYALATDAAGSFIASGSPEKVVRTWDPRSGKRTGKLVGHTDNIRSILVSDDGRYLLTGSADASIKLWSMAASNRCLHTFAHHTESVWSMYSSHPSLSLFYSGDRAGNVCRVDVDGSASLSEGECVLLCKETSNADGIGTEGITGLSVLDDQFVFTATSSSTINCWKIPGSRRTRIAEGAGAEVEQEASSPSPAPFMGGVSPFGFSLDSVQPSLLRSRQRDSFSAEKDWNRSDSPSSIDPPRRMESPTRTSPRNIPRHPSTLNMEASNSSLNPSDSSLHTAVGNNQPTTTSNLFGIAYHSLIRLSSPADGWTSPISPRVKDSDAGTLYSAASIKSVPVPIHQLSFRGQSQSDASRTPAQSQPQPAINAVLRRSMASFEGVMLGTATSAGGISGRYATNPPEDTEDAARLAYESRDVAEDATPVRTRPDYSLQGTQGIVRSVVLCDRWHALTVDTMGHVGVWDIVRGLCIGMYEKQDVEEATRIEASRGGHDEEWKWSPREALDVVRERIEGEAVVHAWCTVDTSIGNLMVHITSTQAFDAEIFADEAGYHGEFKFEEDLRLNIGKWVLGNLFAPFVARQKIIQSEPDYFPDLSTAEASQSPPGLITRGSISRQGGPRHINLEARKIRSIAEIIPSHRTPGVAASPASIPMTPALLPDLPLGALEKVAAANAAKHNEGGHSGDAGKAHTPHSMAGTTPRGPRRSATLDETTSGTHNVDYFTVRRRSSLGKEEAVEALTAVTGPSPDADGNTGPANPPPPPPTLMTPSTPAAGLTTPGSTTHVPSTPFGFMGKLKALGKQKKTGGITDASEAANASATSGATDGEKAEPVKPPTPTLLQKIMSKPLNLPDFNDVPPIDINPMSGIVISQVAPEAASGWAPVYRGLYSTQAEDEDIDILEQELPGWILEFLLINTVGGVLGGGGPTIGQKFSFMVVPWKGSDSSEELPELLSSQSRLTASRWLRVRKILSYVKDKVDAIELAEKRKDAELQLVGEDEPLSGPIPRSPSSKSVRSATRTSHDASPGSPRPAAGKVLTPPGSALTSTPPQTSTQASRTRPVSTSSNRSTGSGGHHQSSRHRKASRATIGEEGRVEKRPQDLYELLCHDMILPNEMTLAAVKKYKWKGGGELVMEYRKKKPQA